MWDRWESIAAAQARADQEDAERREDRSRPKPPDAPRDATEPPQRAVGWEATEWTAPRPLEEAKWLHSQGYWNPEQPERALRGLMQLLQAMLPDDPTEEDTNG